MSPAFSAPRSRTAPGESDPFTSGAVRGRPAAVQRVPLLLLVLIVSLLLTDAAVIDARHADVSAALAADEGRGPVVPLPKRIIRRAAPISVRIGRLGISSSLVDLHRQPDGALQVPSDFQRVGWYVGSSHPGDPGPTVLVGHVDSYRGPAVFYRLRDLRRGDVITVGRADKTQARFVVQRVLQVPKRSFPTQLVYVGDGRPSLRLVTCGGAFDRRSGHYLENTVVLAVPEARAPRPTELRRRRGKPS